MSQLQPAPKQPPSVMVADDRLTTCLQALLYGDENYQLGAAEVTPASETVTGHDGDTMVDERLERKQRLLEPQPSSVQKQDEFGETIRRFLETHGETEQDKQLAQAIRKTVRDCVIVDPVRRQQLLAVGRDRLPAFGVKTIVHESNWQYHADRGSVVVPLSFQSMAMADIELGFYDVATLERCARTNTAPKSSLVRTQGSMIVRTGLRKEDAIAQCNVLTTSRPLLRISNETCHLLLEVRVAFAPTAGLVARIEYTGIQYHTRIQQELLRRYHASTINEFLWPNADVPVSRDLNTKMNTSVFSVPALIERMPLSITKQQSSLTWSALMPSSLACMFGVNFVVRTDVTFGMSSATLQWNQIVVGNGTITRGDTVQGRVVEWLIHFPTFADRDHLLYTGALPITLCCKLMPGAQPLPGTIDPLDPASNQVECYLNAQGIMAKPPVLFYMVHRANQYVGDYYQNAARLRKRIIKQAGPTQDEYFTRFPEQMIHQAPSWSVRKSKPRGLFGDDSDGNYESEPDDNDDEDDECTDDDTIAEMADGLGTTLTSALNTSLAKQLHMNRSPPAFSSPPNSQRKPAGKRAV